MSLAARVAELLDCVVTGEQPLHGGDLSAIYRVALADGGYVVAKMGRDVAAEATMLLAIRQAGAPAPAVLAHDDDVLVMEWVEAASGIGPAWDDLARVLNLLHGEDARAAGRSGHATYGWDGDYAFGAVPIANTTMPDWPSFWNEKRLLCHLPHLPLALARRVEHVCRTLPERLPSRPPVSLLHGDLWGGNVLTCGATVAALIDPACYYGDREVDIAMLGLFDRPPERFYAALDLPSDWRERQPIYCLWPWLVHLRLFGGGYQAAVESCLRAARV